MSAQPPVAEIGNAFELGDGLPQLPGAAFARFSAAVAQADATTRDAIAVDVMVLMRRLWNEANDSWDDAIVQLALLLAVALGPGRADAAIGAQLGAAARKAIGAEVARVAPGGARPAGALSPLGARLRASAPRPKSGDGSDDAT